MDKIQYDIRKINQDIRLYEKALFLLIQLKKLYKYLRPSDYFPFNSQFNEIDQMKQFIQINEFLIDSLILAKIHTNVTGFDNNLAYSHLKDKDNIVHCNEEAIVIVEQYIHWLKTLKESIAEGSEKKK